jgi:hypothetical protein
VSHYRVLLHGRNFLLLHGVRGEADHAIKMGFYTNRFIESPGQSISPALLNQIIEDVRAKVYPVNPEDDPPEIMIDQIWPISEQETIEQAGADVAQHVQGLFLYPEDKKAHRRWVLANFRVASRLHSGRRYRFLLSELAPDEADAEF